VKVSFIVLIGSVISFAQIPDTYHDADSSVHDVSAKSLRDYHFNPLPSTTYLSFINSNTFNEQDSARQRMDSIISNSVTGGKLKLIFEYDNNDNITAQLIGVWTGSGWFYDLKDEFFYDENQKLLLQLNLGLNGTSWDSLSRFNYEYNIQGQLTQYIIQEYINSNWENFLRVSLEYDLNGNEIQNLTEEWQNSWQYLHLFNNYFSNINRRDSLLFQVWNSTEWENYGKTAFTYNQQTGFLEYFIGKIWNNGTWENYINRRITNDQNGNQTLQEDQLWDGNNWENSIRRFFTYDGLNYTLTAYCELWNGSQWYLDDGDIIIKNPDGFRIGFIMNNVFIYYKTTGVNDEISYFADNYILYQNYPNPFNSSTKIKYTIPQSGKVTLKIFDLMGSEVATIVDKHQITGSYDLTFNANNLSSGIYFCQLQSGSFKATKKLILLK
jgi:hypothetical protein